MKIIENLVRNYIRKKMFKHKLEDVFKMIQEEYSTVYHEDNFFDRKEFLHELVDKTMPEKYDHLV
jgi:hypothetical protein